MVRRPGGCPGQEPQFGGDEVDGVCLVQGNASVPPRRMDRRACDKGSALGQQGQVHIEVSCKCKAAVHKHPGISIHAKDAVLDREIPMPAFKGTEQQLGSPRGA